MNFTPFGTNVVIRIEEKIQKTASGLYIPEAAEKPRIQGTIVAVGLDVNIPAMSVGSKVLFSYNNASQTPLQDVIVVPLESVLCKIE